MGVKIYEKNPTSNKIPSGITEDAIDKAVLKSGYPLQTRISKNLSDRFFVQEEWSFVDKKTGDVRNTDILAERSFWDEDKKQPRVRPTLNLIIECKRSELPYIFFLSEDTPSVPHFPFIVGLHDDNIILKTGDDPSTWQMPILSCLGLDDEKFLKGDVNFCSKFSKCERKGDDLILSGETPFNGIVHPLLNAMNHFKIAEHPIESAYYFDFHIVLAVGVLDAPMIGVKLVGNKHELVSLPWVRVIKHQTDKNPDFSHRRNVFAIDIVHADFLDTYINDNVFPFVTKISELVIKHQNVIANGEGYVPQSKNIWRSSIEKKLFPVTFSYETNRCKSIVRNVFSFLKLKKN